MDVDIVVVSDLHLGYQEQSLRDFTYFVRNYLAKNEITNLVLLGDILEFWRVCPTHLREACWKILEEISTLDNIQKTFYIHGNHDYIVYEPETRKQLRLGSFGFEFPPYPLYLKSGDRQFFFLHGYELKESEQYGYTFYRYWCRYYCMLVCQAEERWRIGHSFWQWLDKIRQFFFWRRNRKRRKHCEQAADDIEAIHAKGIDSFYQFSQAQKDLPFIASKKMRVTHNKRKMIEVCEAGLTHPSSRGLFDRLKDPSRIIHEAARAELWQVAQNKYKLKKDDFMIIGHTHGTWIQPPGTPSYIPKSSSPASKLPQWVTDVWRKDFGGIANAGCWTQKFLSKKNSYLVIKDGKIRGFPENVYR